MAILGRNKESAKIRELTDDGEYFRVGEVFRVRSHTHNELFETVYFDLNIFYDYCYGCDFESICKERRIQIESTPGYLGVPFLPVPACTPGDRLDGRHVHFKKI